MLRRSCIRVAHALRVMVRSRSICTLPPVEQLERGDHTSRRGALLDWISLDSGQRRTRRIRCPFDGDAVHWRPGARAGARLPERRAHQGRAARGAGDADHRPHGGDRLSPGSADRGAGVARIGGWLRSALALLRHLEPAQSRRDRDPSDGPQLDGRRARLLARGRASPRPARLRRALLHGDRKRRRGARRRGFVARQHLHAAQDRRHDAVGRPRPDVPAVPDPVLPLLQPDRALQRALQGHAGARVLGPHRAHRRDRASVPDRQHPLHRVGPGDVGHRGLRHHAEPERSRHAPAAGRPAELRDRRLLARDLGWQRQAPDRVPGARAGPLHHRRRHRSLEHVRRRGSPAPERRSVLRAVPGQLHVHGPLQDRHDERLRGRSDARQPHARHRRQPVRAADRQSRRHRRRRARRRDSDVAGRRDLGASGGAGHDGAVGRLSHPAREPDLVPRRRGDHAADPRDVAHRDDRQRFDAPRAADHERDARRGDRRADRVRVRRRADLHADAAARAEHHLRGVAARGRHPRRRRTTA